MTIDSTGDGITTKNTCWSFADDTSKNFDSHVSKSVPFYREGHDLVCRLSDFFLTDNSIMYELGSSTGALLSKIAAWSHKNATFIGIDSVEEMVNKAKEKNPVKQNVQFICDDILGYEFEPADLIVSYYTMQFIRPGKRQFIFDKIYHSLNWGGALILFEKVRAPDARFQDMMSSLYKDYKLEQGYSADEILGKERSLKGVLEPFSTQGNLDLLKRAGFVDVMTVMKYLCFEGFIAIK